MFWWDGMTSFLPSPTETITVLNCEFVVLNFISIWSSAPFKPICPNAGCKHETTTSTRVVLSHDLWTLSPYESEAHVSKQWWTRFSGKRVWWDEQIDVMSGHQKHFLPWSDRQNLTRFLGWRGCHASSKWPQDSLMGNSNWNEELGNFSLNETTPSHHTFSSSLLLS